MNALNPNGNGTPAHDEKIPCVVCREPILPGAKVCVHCNRSQNWTRHLMRWSTIAGAIVAVMSLVSTSISLRGLISSPANLKVIPLACEKESVALAVSNLGDKPGMVRRVAVQIMADGSLLQKEAVLTAASGQKIVKPHETEKIEYVMLSSGLPIPLPIPSVGVEKMYPDDHRSNSRFRGWRVRSGGQVPLPLNSKKRG